MDAQDIYKKYYAVDTFSGFTDSDIAFEVSKRGKARDMYAMIFKINTKKYFDAALSINNITRVISIEADVNKYNFKELGPLSFVLLDIDLYLPIKKSLEKLYPMLSPGGMIIVDDCDPKDIRWDGTAQAYREFMKEIGQPAKIIHKKLGILLKNT